MIVNFGKLFWLNGLTHTPDFFVTRSFEWKMNEDHV